MNWTEPNNNKKESWIKPVKPDSELFLILDKGNTPKIIEETNE